MSELRPRPPITRALLPAEGRSSVHLDRLAHLVDLLAYHEGTREPPAPPFDRFRRLRTALREGIRGGDPDEVEETFLELYAHLHLNEVPYTGDERRRVDETGGYWSHAGGVDPILAAADWITPSSISLDLGAGTGLQGLLLQHLTPHRLCVQLEISCGAVVLGRRLREWLGVPASRIGWTLGDVTRLPVLGADLVYLYRPVRPTAAGIGFYRELSRRLEKWPAAVTVVSIADCLRPFLSEGFRTVHHDGHTTIIRRDP